ncbi:MAG: hypothetical protein AAGK02_12075 [Pseudomonadota bacterium]
MKLIKTVSQGAAVALLTTLAACSAPESSEEAGLNEDFVNDTEDMQAGIEAAAAELSPELREAASKSGDLACGLPLLPDHRAGRVTDNNKTSTFNTDETPETVMAFYRAAAYGKGGVDKINAVPGLADQTIAFNNAMRCRIVAQAQLSGDTNVTVGFE